MVYTGIGNDITGHRSLIYPYRPHFNLFACAEKSRKSAFARHRENTSRICVCVYGDHRARTVYTSYDAQTLSRGVLFSGGI